MIEISNILDVEKYIDNVDAVVFDLDDTLYPEKEYVKSGYDSIANEYPNIKKMSERLWNAFMEGKPSIDFVLEQENLIGEKENCLKVYRHHNPSIHLFNGVKEMLLRIKKIKKIGIITDGRPEGQKAKVNALHLEKMVDQIIITDELGGTTYRKPNPAAFILMSQKLKCDLSRMIYVGDNVQKDFIAPNLLGMISIYFINKNGLYYKNNPIKHK